MKPYIKNKATSGEGSYYQFSLDYKEMIGEIRSEGFIFWKWMQIVEQSLI